MQCIWFTRFTNALFHQWQNQSSCPAGWFYFIPYPLFRISIFPSVSQTPVPHPEFSSDSELFTVTLYPGQPNFVQTNRPNLCWIQPMALLGFPQVLSQLPQCQFCMSVQGKKIKISEELISISHFSNWVCRFIPKTNPPLLWDHWMGAALRNPSKKSEASWSKCLPEIKRYSGTQFCLLYWELWPDKKITWQKAFTPFTCYFNISSRLLHKQKIFCILFSLCIGDTTLQIGAICEIRTIGNK